MAGPAVGASRSGTTVRDESYYRAAAREAAKKHGIPEEGFEAQIEKESGFNSDVITGRRRSSAGALGIAQFMPGTAAGLGINPLNPEQALDASAKLMRSYYDKYGAWGFALVAYNAGPGWADKLHKRTIRFDELPSETQNYVKALGGKYGSRSVGAGVGTAVGAAGDVAQAVTPDPLEGALSGILDTLKFIADPKTWIRIGGMLIGAVGMIAGTYFALKSSDAGRPIGIAIASLGFVWLWASVRAVNPADMLKSLVGADG